jgi:hypothetical protein
VRVEDAGRVHGYTVQVEEEDVERLSGGKTVEDLVERSFRFLLERESAQSILREFRLMEIARYFPEYTRVIAG